MKVGIDAIAFDIPKIYLPIATLATQRNIEPDKLIKGLGLQKMSFPDAHQDVVTFAANACLKLIVTYKINPAEIARIYVGSESGVDSSKPIASYVVSLLEQKSGAATFRNCDVVDLTFACIGGVDALQNCLDFIRLNPSKKAIVIASDNAKYDLGSSGEYTQGAGAVAMLLSASPQLLCFAPEVGVATEGVFDFFKPRRTVSKATLVASSENPEWFGVLENEVAIYKEQPVFDGHYSNQCYIDRITEAYIHFKKESQQKGKIYENWAAILMHLPYCFQGRRTFIELVAHENQEIVAQQLGATQKEQVKAFAKSSAYLELVEQKIYPSEIASGQIGNCYTASIFIGLLSALHYHAREGSNLAKQKFGFIAYGSGSKAKVFEATVGENWKKCIDQTHLFQTLEERHPIDFETYEKLHKKELQHSVVQPKQEFVLASIEQENPVLVGARRYEFVE